ncbi:MAG TPA: glycosyltransferase family 2 protein, partial [Actinomycetota bacterium]|nr:glycosyltransferase family 2 protein [Actinomycetota bacterium]
MASPDTLSVVVPVFNEAERLRESLDRLLKVELPLELEIIVVDDGSTDGSASTISDLVDEGRVKLISHERNRGKSHAVRTGIGAATGDLL